MAKNSSKSKLTKDQTIQQYGNYGVHRTAGVPTNVNNSQGTDTKKRKSLVPVFLWIFGAVGLVLFGFGIFTFFRVSAFVTDSFSGRNEASLLASQTSPNIAGTNTPSVQKPIGNIVGVTPISTATPNGAQANRPGATAPGNITFAPIATPTPNLASLAPIIQKIKRGEKVSLLVAGFGGENHDGRYLTDTILQIVYDPVKNSATMVNLPRDLYVFIPYGGTKVGFWGKINSAFSYVMESRSPDNLSARYRFTPGDSKSQLDGAANLLKDVVEQVTYIPVDYWAIFSFDGFRRFIEAVGGVYVDVDVPFDDYEYPANDNPNIDAGVIHLHFDAGRQYMNGERAIQYARSRKSAQDGSDFGRSRRQMKLIGAVKEQAAQPETMLKVFGIMDALQGQIRTSLSLDDGRALLEYYRGEGVRTLQGMTLVPQILSTNNYLTSDTTSDGAYILVPIAGQGNYKPLQQWLQRTLEFPELRAENLRVQVQNATGQNYNVIQELNENLTRAGLETLDLAWAKQTTNSFIIDYTNGKSKNSLAAIKKFLPDVPVKTAEKPNQTTPDIVILLGKDISFAPDTDQPNMRPAQPASTQVVSDVPATTTPRPRPTATPRR